VYLASRGDSVDSPDLTPVPESVIRIARSEGRPAKATRARASKSRTVIASHGSSHSKKNKVRVGRGDSLWSIAQRHGVSVAAVKRANRIRNSHLTPGQVLAIPSR
jgi:LysM repeat protein